MSKTRRSLAPLMLALVIGLTQPVHISGQTSEQVKAGVVATIDKYLAESEKDGFSGAILLVKGDTVLLRKGYGYADCKRRVKVSPDVIFDLGSITKTITGIAVLKLQAQGKLNIDDPIALYLEGVPEDKAGITIQHLLLHASGFQDSFGNDEDYVNKDWLLKRALISSLLFKPGEKESYSNVGYSLLGAIIEKVSGKSYEQYVNENILRPVRLSATGHFIPRWGKKQLACGFLDGKPWGSVKDYYGKQEPSWHLMANGGMLSTVSELDAWFTALLQNKIVPEPMTNFYKEAVARRTPSGTHMISTSGANNIFSSLYIRWLEEDLRLVLFTSNSRWQKEKLQATLVKEVQKLIPGK